MRIVLDTNALLMALPRKSPYRPIFDAFLSGKITLLLDTGILNEYIEVLERRTDVVVAQNVGELMVNSPHVARITVTTHWLLITEDPDDNKFVDCAIAGRADYLVTNDRHFNAVKDIGFPPVTVLSIDDFLKMVETL